MLPQRQRKIALIEKCSQNKYVSANIGVFYVVFCVFFCMDEFNQMYPDTKVNECTKLIDYNDDDDDDEKNVF